MAMLEDVKKLCLITNFLDFFLSKRFISYFLKYNFLKSFSI